MHSQKTNNKLKFLFVFLLLIFIFKPKKLLGQTNLSLNTKFKEGLKIYMNDDSSRYLKASGLAQIWLRYNDNNPGSAIYGDEVKKTFDVGIRRMRYQVLSQLNRRVFFYSQIGINSVNYLSARKTQIFFHDVTAEYEVLKKFLTIGIGLHGWNGISRYSSSGVANILCLDLPVVQESTNDISDQFVRKNGIFLKGKIKSLDYRISISNPYPIQQVSSVASLPASETNVAYFSTKAPELQYQGYFMWQFLEKESNQVPYMTGSYLGKKRVLTLGAGFASQKNAMWYRNVELDTISCQMLQLGVDLFYDYAFNKAKENALTLYISYLNYDFGPNFIRNTGIMNTANSAGSGITFGGYGDALPYYGTGKVMYGQMAYLFRKDLLGKQGTIQPYVSGFNANYERLTNSFFVYNLGINWIQNGQQSKISFDYQSRPIFVISANEKPREIKSARRGCVIIQYQVTF